MKSDSGQRNISFKEALRIIWEWRQAAISVQVCFFCQPGSSQDVRVSIDGVVQMVDSEGVVTISGDGRGVDLDLRGCEITMVREGARKTRLWNALDPDSILQVKFPNGEICLIFPYRRVGCGFPGERRPETGREWLQTALSRAVDDNRHPTKFRAGFFSLSTLAKSTWKVSKPRTGRSGPPLFPAAALLLVFLVVALAMSPSSVPKLLGELGVHPKMTDPNTLVWVIPQDGNYYCHGSVLSGREPGRLMEQGEALTKGYQPALGSYCQGTETARVDNGENGFVVYFRTVRQGGQALFSRLRNLSRVWLPLSSIG